MERSRISWPFFTCRHCPGGNNNFAVLLGGLGTQTQIRATHGQCTSKRAVSDLFWPIGKETRPCFFANDKWGVQCWKWQCQTYRVLSMHNSSVLMVGKVQTKLELFPLPKQHCKLEMTWDREITSKHFRWAPASTKINPYFLRTSAWPHPRVSKLGISISLTI